jgi:hypothetical protein
VAKAFECDKCKELIKIANGDDLFYAHGFRIEVKYLKGIPGGWAAVDLCLDCRFKLLEQVLKGLNIKMTLSWQQIDEVADSGVL